MSLMLQIIQFFVYNDFGGDAFPSWSPDGQHIAFELFQSGQWGVYVVNADGSGLTPLTANAEYTNPVWSPRDPFIAFVGDSNSSNANIYMAFWIAPCHRSTSHLMPSTDPSGRQMGPVSLLFFSIPTNCKYLCH